MQRASAMLQAGNFALARTMLEQVLRESPHFVEAHRLLAGALQALDDAAGAERVLRTAIAIDPRWTPTQTALGEILLNQGRLDEAEPLLRAACAGARPYPRAQQVLARLLNLRAQQCIANGDTTGAEDILRETVALDPLFADAHSHLAQLVWMRSADINLALRELNRAIAQQPGVEVLHLVRTDLLESAGESDRAHALLAAPAQRADASAELLLRACRTNLRTNAANALAYAQRAVAAQPTHEGAQRALIDALLANGDAAVALRHIEVLVRMHPDDQQLIATQTTAWRLLDDARYTAWCDYTNMARAWMIDTPRGWSDLASYLADLATSLRRLHSLHAHPLYNSLRGGSQTAQDLSLSDDPVIRTFFEAIDGPIRRHIATIDADQSGVHPLGRRKRDGYRVNGIWSVRLRGQGYHTNHVHPAGWLSSACYIELPRAVIEGAHVDGRSSASATGEDRVNPGNPGWLKFGEPGIPTQPPLAPEHGIRPQPGLLALFPSYFWHGTVPFDGDDTRLTIAFDVVPV